MFLFRREGPYLEDVVSDVDVASSTSGSRAGRLLQLRGHLRRIRPDIVVAFLSYFSVLLAARAARVGAKVVFNQQTPVTPFLADRDYRWAGPAHKRTFAAVARVAYRTADHIVAASRGVADDLVARFRVSADRIDVVHNPVDLRAIERLAREPLDPEEQQRWKPPVVVAVGRLAEQKNYPLLIDALAILRSRMPARLFVLGDGVLRQPLTDRIAQRGLGDAVTLCGFQRNPWKYLARADAFALTSRYEGFGNVMVEAMACGVPVVATSSDVTREVVRDGLDGLLVERHEPEAVAAALERVLCNADLRRRLIDGGYASARRFDLPRIAAEYDTVFTRLLA